MDQYQASGPGTQFLARPALQFLLTTDPFLGTTTPGVPDGPFNRELYKLLENDSALANLMMGYLTRTFGASAEEAPTVGVIPDPLTGASLTPADLAMHTVYYLDYEVVYRYDGTEGEWVEQTRISRLFSVFQKHTKKITVVLEDGEDNISVPIPTTDDDDVAFAFTLDDLKTFYISNLDSESPILSVLPGLVIGEAVITVVASSAPEIGANYELVMVFENIEVI